MLNNRKIVILLSSVVIACVLIFLVITHRSGQEGIVNNDRNLNEGKNGRPGLSPEGYAAIISEEILKKAEANLPEEVLRPGATHLSADGVRTILPDEYTSDTPIVELHFMARELNGTMHAVKLDDVDLESKEPPSVRGYRMYAGTILRVGATDHLYRHMMRPLLLGAEYEVLSYRPVGVNGPMRDPSPAFRVPKDLGRDEVYKVELLLDDKIWQKRQAEQEAEADRRRQLIAEQEAITVHFNEYPEGAYMVCVYIHGQEFEEFDSKDPNRPIVLKGPNKLGGELGAYTYDKTGTGSRLWAYIESLRRRTIQLPEQADLYVRDEELIDVQLNLLSRETQALERIRAVALYSHERAMMPLFMDRNVGQFKSADDHYYKTAEIKVVPGTYFIRLANKKDEQADLCELAIAKEPGKVYEVNVPADLGLWKKLWE